MIARMTHANGFALAASAALLLGLASPASALSAASISLDMTNFTGDDILGRATLEQVGDDIKVTLETVQSGGYVNTGDWGAFWFNVSDDSVLAGMTVSGADVTAYDFSGGVGSVGGANNNLNGGGSPGLMDAGIAFGSPGGAGGLIETTMFTLSHIDGLSLSLFDGQTFAGRLQSVGPAPSGGGGSSKIVGTHQDNPIPEPTTALLAALGIGSLAAGRRRA